MHTTTVYSEIKSYIDQHGGDYRNWYAGIASDPRRRLFIEHNVDEKHGAWIFRTAASDTAARAAEIALLALGCKGGDGGGGHKTCCVYAYRITATTRE